MSTTNPDQMSVPPPYSVTEFSQDLTTLLGDAERKANEWVEQRKALQSRLTELRDTADRLLRRLATDQEDGPRDTVVAPPSAVTANVTTTRKDARRKATNRHMSAEAKERIAAAQRARWARQRRQ